MAERTFRIQSPAGLRQAFVAAWALAGTLIASGDGYELVLRKLKSKRSIEQNKRYWALLREVAACAWIDDRQYKDTVWHEHFKREFIGCEDLPGGAKLGISSTTLSIQEMGDYMTKIEHWAAEQGWPVMQEAA